MAVTVTSITPNFGAQGGHLFHVVIHGTGFVAGAVVTFSGANVAPEAATTVIDSATQIHLNVVINGGAALGRRTVTVTNLDASTGSLVVAFTVTLLSFTAYQPYNHLPGLARNCLLYDPRGDVAPYLYSIGGAPNNAGASSHVWALNRRTGVITDHTGQFHNWPSFGPPDMDEFGVLWWIGIEVGNLTQSKEAQTAFAADTLTKIGSVPRTASLFCILQPAKSASIAIARIILFGRSTKLTIIQSTAIFTVGTERRAFVCTTRLPRAGMGYRWAARAIESGILTRIPRAICGASVSTIMQSIPCSGKWRPMGHRR